MDAVRVRAARRNRRRGTPARPSREQLAEPWLVGRTGRYVERIEQLLPCVVEQRHARCPRQDVRHDVWTDVAVLELLARVQFGTLAKPGPQQIPLVGIAAIGPASRHGQQLTKGRPSRSVIHVLAIFRQEILQRRVDTTDRAFTDGDADQGRHDALGDRLKVGVLSRVAAVVPLCEDFTIDTDQDGTKFVEPGNIVRLRCVDGRADLVRGGRSSLDRAG